MRKNGLLFITLFVSLVASVVIGKVIYFEGSKMRFNKSIENKITEIISNQNSTPILPSLIPNDTRADITPKQNITAETLAQCLNDKNFTMYGSPECPSCALQHEYFGESFAKVPYVNCLEEKELCKSKKITAYPTWEDEEGNKYKGAIPLDILAKLSKCQT